MISYVWPLLLILVSNTLYQICTKTQPDGLNPFAFLTVTYLVGSLVCLVIYFVTSRGGNILKDFSHLSWSPFVLGLVVVGLEAGYLYAYKAGWQVSTLPVVQASLLAGVLVIVGFFLYHEKVSWNKIVGIVACIIGLFFINLK